MSSDETYDDERADRLVALLRTLSARIDSLRRTDDLLAASPELLQLMGDARSELFHYEVRSTFDTPGQMESRRIVDDARQRQDAVELPDGFEFDNGEGYSWLG